MVNRDQRQKLIESLEPILERRHCRPLTRWTPPLRHADPAVTQLGAALQRMWSEHAGFRIWKVDRPAEDDHFRATVARAILALQTELEADELDLDVEPPDRTPFSWPGFLLGLLLSPLGFMLAIVAGTLLLSNTPSASPLWWVGNLLVILGIAAFVLLGILYDVGLLMELRESRHRKEAPDAIWPFRTAEQLHAAQHRTDAATE